MLGSKLNYVSERGPRYTTITVALHQGPESLSFQIKTPHPNKGLFTTQCNVNNWKKKKQQNNAIGEMHSNVTPRHQQPHWVPNLGWKHTQSGEPALQSNRPKGHSTLYWACDYLSMLGSKLNYVSERGPRSITITVALHQGPESLSFQRRHNPPKVYSPIQCNIDNWEKMI